MGVFPTPVSARGPVYPELTGSPGLTAHITYLLSCVLIFAALGDQIWGSTTELFPQL